MHVTTQQINPEVSTKQSGLIIHGDFVPDLCVQLLDGLILSNWVSHTHYLSKDMTTCAVGLPSYGVVLVYQLSFKSWVKAFTIRADEDNTSAFGKAVGVSNDGSIVLVGDENYERSGAAFCYVKKQNEWGLVGRIDPRKDRHNFGSVISVKNGYFYIYDSSGGVFVDPLKLKKGAEKNMFSYKDKQK